MVDNMIAIPARLYYMIMIGQFMNYGGLAIYKDIDREYFMLIGTVMGRAPENHNRYLDAIIEAFRLSEKTRKT